MFFKKFDKNKPVMDLGANKGQTAIIFWFRGVETYCVEPHPIIFKDLQDIFSDTKYIHTINAAVVASAIAVAMTIVVAIIVAFCLCVCSSCCYCYCDCDCKCYRDCD